MFYNEAAKTIHIDQIFCKGRKLRPEKIMRIIHMWYHDFVNFHKLLDEILTLAGEWPCSLITKFSVLGGWLIPKAPLIHHQMSVFSLGNYARWFYDLPNGRTLCCLFKQNENENDPIFTETATHYSGFYSMDVTFFFIDFSEN